jgi:hypothetical protein
MSLKGKISALLCVKGKTNCKNYKELTRTSRGPVPASVLRLRRRLGEEIAAAVNGTAATMKGECVGSSLAGR